MSVVSRIGTSVGDVVTSLTNVNNRNKIAHVEPFGDAAFWLSPAARLWLVIALTAIDLTAIGVAVGFALASFPDHILLAAVTTLAATGILLAAQMSGSYRLSASSDILPAAGRMSAACFLWLLASCIAARVFFGPEDVAAVLRSLGSGNLVVLFGRLLLVPAVGALAGRLTERVLLIGSFAAVTRQARSGRLLGQRVNYIGAMMVEDTALASLPLPLSLDPADGNPRSDGGGDVMLLGKVDRIVLVKTGLPDGRLVELLQKLDSLAADIHILEQSLPRGVLGLQPREVCSRLRRPTISYSERVIKRALDIMLSVVLLIVLLPALLLVALSIRIESDGPALFRQSRLGRNNLPFTVLKFRSMRVGSAATDGSVQASRGDSRVTRVGAILRKTSIDELPQLFNVLGGSMSLVGPRPHPTELNRRFEPLIPNYSARHSVTPGITGLAQIKGFRGETSTVDLMNKRVELDLEYIRRRSTAFDIWILVRTVVSVLTTRNAY